MNLHAPLPDRATAEEWETPAGIEVTPALSHFARATAPRASRNVRTVGVTGVLVMHGLLALAYLFGGPTFVRTAQQSVTVIDIAEELPKKVEPPPPPKFLPPEVYVPVPIVPLLTLDEPPPTPKAITLPPAPENPIAPTAPLVQTAVPFEGGARDAYVATLFKHLNKFKRYPEAAKLRHEQGVVSLRFTINREGRVLAASITKGSGSKALDAEVLAAVRRADPLPRIPAIFAREELDLVIPVEFVLR